MPESTHISISSNWKVCFKYEGKASKVPGLGVYLQHLFPLTILYHRILINDELEVGTEDRVQDPTSELLLRTTSTIWLETCPGMDRKLMRIPCRMYVQYPIIQYKNSLLCPVGPPLSADNW